MGLRTKFNLAILVAFGIGFAITALSLKHRFEQAARQEVIGAARVMMSAANSIRRYTAEVITPLVGIEKDGKFQSVSVPAFAARVQFEHVQAEYPDYSYKEATLNPTNPANRTTDWEADIVNRFRQPNAEPEIIVERETPMGASLSLARPLAIKNGACLACHSQPKAAPLSMTAMYGTANGFGWHVNEVVGAQIVSLPMAVPLAKSHETLLIFLGILVAIFVLMTLILNVLLHYLVIRPVKTISDNATAVSLGRPASQYTPTGNDEISELSVAFNRMRHSLEHAMELLDADGPQTQRA